jgi:succinate dehydrogenase flavin-adding protein (antitoxin of CptAB toxin-antitoxin module)
MSVTLTKQAGLIETEEKDFDELLECCDNDMSTDKLKPPPQVYGALTELNVLTKKQQSV